MAGRAGRRDRSDRCGCEWRSGRGARCDIPSTWPHPQRGTVFHAPPPPGLFFGRGWCGPLRVGTGAGRHPGE
jgi:hypothetical protein